MPKQMGPIERELRAVVLPGLFLPLSEKASYFTMACAVEHGMRGELLRGVTVDADVLSYAIEAAAALRE